MPPKDHLKKIHRGTSSTQKDLQSGVLEQEPFCSELSMLNTYFFFPSFFKKIPQILSFQGLIYMNRFFLACPYNSYGVYTIQLTIVTTP